MFEQDITTWSDEMIKFSLTNFDLIDNTLLLCDFHGSNCTNPPKHPFSSSILTQNKMNLNEAGKKV